MLRICATDIGSVPSFCLERGRAGHGEEPVASGASPVDTTSKLAFVRTTRPRELGESVAFWRAGQSVAKGTIEQVMGEVVTVRYGDTAPKKGDEVR